jgi:hypothetical protein
MCEVCIQSLTTVRYNEKGEEMSSKDLQNVGTPIRVHFPFFEPSILSGSVSFSWHVPVVMNSLHPVVQLWRVRHIPPEAPSLTRNEVVTAYSFF